MTSVELRTDLAEWIQQIAAREQRSIDDVVEGMLACYDEPTMLLKLNPTAAIPTSVRDVERRLYEEARTYWREHDDPRQHLTDEEMDAQFWRFDHDGVPRMKAEQGTITIPPHPFEAVVAMIEADTSIEWHEPPYEAPEVSKADYANLLVSLLRTSDRVPTSENE